MARTTAKKCTDARHGKNHLRELCLQQPLPLPQLSHLRMEGDQLRASTDGEAGQSGRAKRSGDDLSNYSFNG